MQKSQNRLRLVGPKLVTSKGLQHGYADLQTVINYISVYGYDNDDDYWCADLQFRPKNFEKPEALFTTPTDRVKREPRDSQTTGPKKSHAAGSLDRKKKEAVGQDQVVFGGGIGGMCR